MAESQQNENNIVKQSNLNPPIMKVDAPNEETTNQDDETNEKLNNEEFKICSPTKPCSPSKSRGILKPPQLSLNKTPTPKFTLNPSRLNPFCKLQDDSNGDSKGSQANGEIAPKFVPLVQTEANPIPQTTPTTNSTTTFVFGQNLQDRAIAAEKSQDEPKPSTSLNSNGTSEMLFTSAVKNDIKNEGRKDTTKTLSESAKEYEESRANKRKYEEVEVITGEEEETNILSMSCKLFAFDKGSGSWQERGRGTLRLNDLDVDESHTQSRLVFRTGGSLRVILNTKIWAEMTVEQASEKSIRFTALDANGEIKVFLIMSNIEDSKQLFNQLQCRLQKEISTQKHKKCNSNSSEGDLGHN